MKKKIIIFVIFILVARLMFFVIMVYVQPAHSIDDSVVIDNREDYDTIALLCYNDFLEHEYKKGVRYMDGEFDIHCFAGEKEDDDYDIYLNREQQKALNTINETFRIDKCGVDYIYVCDGFVVFHTINGRASLIYSVDDVVPRFVNEPDETNKRVAHRKVTDNWYSVCHNNECFLSF